MSICDGCDRSLSDCMKDKPLCKKDVVFCDNCGAGIDWEDLPDDQVVTLKEYHGQQYLRPETVVVGCICPDCGHYNTL